MEELVKDTEAEIDVVRGACEKKDQLIEQMKALQSESNKKQCILEKQILEDAVGCFGNQVGHTG